MRTSFAIYYHRYKTFKERCLASVLRRGSLSLGISLYLQTKLSIESLLDTLELIYVFISYICRMCDEYLVCYNDNRDEFNFIITHQVALG